jgi:hypothetical protein
MADESSDEKQWAAPVQVRAMWLWRNRRGMPPCLPGMRIPRALRGEIACSDAGIAALGKVSAIIQPDFHLALGVPVEAS